MSKSINCKVFGVKVFIYVHKNTCYRFIIILRGESEKVVSAIDMKKQIEPFRFHPLIYTSPYPLQDAPAGYG